MMMEAFLPIEPQWNMPEMELLYNLSKIEKHSKSVHRVSSIRAEVLLRSMDSDFYCLMNTYCIVV
jgi:hypothetical protein